MNKTPEEGFERSRDCIEIDITYKCNKRCNNCDRSCSQAPSEEHMGVEQIEKFVEESIKNNVKWKYIRILGGEPALHPNIFEIVNLLLGYKNSYSPKTLIIFVTNGYGDKVKGVLSKFPEEVIIENSMEKPVPAYDGSIYKPKEESNEFLRAMKIGMPLIFEMPFVIFNNAPQDHLWYKEVDYSRGCWLCNIGVGLTAHGYYHCPIAGGIDRIFGFDKGRKEFPKKEDAMKDQFKVFCRLCGYFRPYKQITSPSWEEAYKKYKIKKPSLSLY